MSEKLKPRSNSLKTPWPLPYLWIQLTVVLIVFLDQVSKFLASNFLKITCNEGIGFGFYLGRLTSIFLSASILVFLTFLLSREKNKLTAFGLILISGGGVSNLLDRIFLGCVRDFISIWIWPSFNLADSAITIGVLLLILSLVKNLANKEPGG